MADELELSREQLREAAYKIIEAVMAHRTAEVEHLAQDLAILATHIRQIEKRRSRTG